MSVTVNNCLNKCLFITDVYNEIIAEEYGTDCNKSCIVTLCDLFDEINLVNYSTDSQLVNYTSDITTVINCTVNLQTINTSCNNLNLVLL